MGWRELRAWIAVVNRQNTARQADPGRWTEASRANFEDLDAQRRKLRGQ